MSVVTKTAPFGPPAIEPLPRTRTHGYSVHLFHKPCVDFHWHFHPEFELVYVEKGRGLRYVGRSIAPYSDGDLCLLGGNLPHAFGSHPEERTGARWMVMHFLPQLFGQQFWDHPLNFRVRKLLAQSNQGVCFRGKAVDPLIAIFKELERNSPSSAGLALWLELLERLARVPEKTLLNPNLPLPAKGARSDGRLQKALGWIDENAARSTLTQAAVARLMGMSPQAFCRFFKHHTGRSFQRYVNELRTARACSHLLNSEKTIGEIAFGCGYNNLANFNRRFRERIGTTPGEYRKNGK